MRRMKGLKAAAVIFGAILLGMAAGPAQGITLSDVSLGSHIYGEKWDIEGLKGRVVLIEFWDTG